MTDSQEPTCIFKANSILLWKKILTFFKVTNPGLILIQKIHQGLLHFNLRFVNYSRFSKLFYEKEGKIRASHDSDKKSLSFDVYGRVFSCINILKYEKLTFYISAL